jgi:hypothetical protein
VIYDIDPWLFEPWKARGRLAGGLAKITSHPLVKQLEGRWHYRPDPPGYDRGTFKCDRPDVLMELQNVFPERLRS